MHSATAGANGHATEDGDSKQSEMNGYAPDDGKLDGLVPLDLESEILSARESIGEFVVETNNIRDEYDNATKRINEAFKDIDSVFNKHKRQVKKFNERKGVIQELREVFAHDPLSLTVLAEMEAHLDSAEDAIDEIGRARRRTGSVFLRLIMGRVSVRVWNEKDRIDFKKEYNRFKERIIWIFYIFPLYHLIFGYSLLVHQIQSITTGYAYLTMGIRENILKLNGSKIEPWWIYHHYLSMMSACLFGVVSVEHPLVVENGFAWQNYFLLWQGIVMTLQVQYQRGRHYTRKAIGRTGATDIRTTEVLNERPTDYWFAILVPCLYLTYFFQYCMGFHCLYVCLTNEWTSRASDSGLYVEYYQMWILSAIWLTLPTGNLLTFLRVLYRKKELQKSIPFGLGKRLAVVLEFVFRDAAKKRNAKSGKKA